MFSKTIQLGKIAYSYKNRKCNLVELEIEIEEIRTQPIFDVDTKGKTLKVEEVGKTGVFDWETLDRVKEGVSISISAQVWNHMNTDILMGGQCLDTIHQYMPDNEILNAILPIWRTYHNNILNAGTRKQTEALALYLEETNQEYNYDKAVEYLTLIGLVEDRGYRYGSKWLYRSVPENIVNALINLANKIS